MYSMPQQAVTIGKVKIENFRTHPTNSLSLVVMKGAASTACV
jgi:hypothetical protein